MTTDEWVRRLNKIARQIDEIESVTHPAAWEEQTRKLREKFKQLAKVETED